MNNTSPITVLIVDDDTLIANLLHDYLASQANITVAGVCFSGNQLLTYLQEKDLKKAIVLLDLKMNDGTGIEAIKVIQKKYAHLKVIALSSHYRLSYTGRMLHYGFHAFLPKETSKEELLAVIHAVSKKGHYLTTDQVSTLRTQISNKAPKVALHTKEKLTPREIEVLQLLCQQMTAKEIAEKLFVSTKTVEAHKSNLLLKTECKNTVGLVIYAMQHKLVSSIHFLE